MLCFLADGQQTNNWAQEQQYSEFDFGYEAVSVRATDNATKYV